MKLPQTWFEFGFEVEITEDGSPSLRLLKPNYADAEKGESMHHSGGAAAETEIIYGRVIQRCFARIERPHFVSVGLGLGYVELTVAREALLKQNLNFSMESFESVPELKNLFIAWLRQQAISHELQSVYDRAVEFVLQGTAISASELKNLLTQKYFSHDWLVQGALEKEFELARPAHTLLFDAFSAKTTPELWDEEFLAQFFHRGLAEDGMISTYACRSSLKRALERTRFQVQVREGFKSKRNSTLGLRGVFAE